MICRTPLCTSTVLGCGSHCSSGSRYLRHDLNLNYLAPDDEPPRRECAAWKAQADAIVHVQVLRLCWPRMPRQVIRRSKAHNGATLWAPRRIGHRAEKKEETQ